MYEQQAKCRSELGLCGVGVQGEGGSTPCPRTQSAYSWKWSGDLHLGESSRQNLLSFF